MKRLNSKVSLTGLCVFVILCLQWIVHTPSALSISSEKVPEPLRPWIDWVLEDETTRQCPYAYNNGNERFCAWPSFLELNLDETSGRFRQTCQVYAESLVLLPGDKDLWPQEVTVDGEPKVVSADAEQPGVMLQPGRHRVDGKFIWPSLPEGLSIPENTGVVTLTVNGKTVPFPDLDPGGRLWLKKSERPVNGQQDREDQLDIAVFRRVVDEIPMEVVTRIELKAAGKERETVLGPVLPQGFIPLDITSTLPARLEPDGRLRLKVRPGTWTINIRARNTSDMTSLTSAKISSPWPEEEVWVFEAKNYLRVVEIKGLSSIDPLQTEMPEDWRHLPAYRVKPGDILRLTVVRRGDPDPSPDQLQLERNLWIDFDGAGYTIQDHITGSMTRDWRLEMNPEIHLGRVLIDEVPQFITRMEGTRKQGVEVRRGALNLTADSRYEQGLASLPTIGWDHDFVQVGATLHLPPGWELISMRGADVSTGTWLAKWTLMDLFLVLIIGISFYKLWRWRWGVCALLAMALNWHEPNAPHYVFLNILAALALLQVLPEGRLKRAATLYRNIGLIALIVIGVPFMVVQVRNALFPQLENPWKPIVAPFTQPLSSEDSGETVMEMAKQPMRSDLKSAKKGSFFEESRDNAPDEQSSARVKELGQIDPNAVVQTGPGIPQWYWKSIPMTWNGPVKRFQRIHLVLLSPKATLFLKFLAVFLLLAVSLICFKTSFGLKLPGFRNLPRDAMALLVIAGFLMFFPQVAGAGFPGPELLKELKTKLLTPPECLPDCAQISRMALNIEKNTLTLRMEIHALGSVGIPLPGKAGQWLPVRVAVDGNEAQGLYRTASGELWIKVDKGIHQVILSGPLPMQDIVQLPLPLKPRYVTHEEKNWVVRGVRENGLADDQLQIERLREASEKMPGFSLEPNVFPPFVKIERTLHLALDWYVVTRVIRVSAQETAVVIEVPLISGESVTTAGFPVKNDKVLVNMGPGQQSLAWRSALKKQLKLTLTAPRTTSWVEIWRADVSTIWHAETTGLHAVHHQDPSGRWLPEWRPWPGESITLRTLRPKGVAGQTMTIDASEIEVRPGSRAVDADLSFTLNSSQGGEHTLQLPENAELQSVYIDGMTQPIRQKGRDVTFPVAPGKQKMALSFRSSNGISIGFKTPAVDFQIPSVNHTIHSHLGTDRWVLWTAGPRMGPAVLFWGVLIVIVFIAIILGRVPGTPVKTWQWLLLGVGLSQTSVFLGLIVVGWLFCLAARKNINPDIGPRRFNLIQTGLGVLTVTAISALFIAVQKGLLGLPEMQIAGNRSTAYLLNWFQDRTGPALPGAWIISVPLTTYRVFMLLWALWLAFSLVSWLRWGWQCFTRNGIWRNAAFMRKKKGDPSNPSNIAGS